MNPAASSVVVESFLKGCFEVLDALFSRSFGPPADMYAASDLRQATAAALDEMLSDYPAALRARLKRGGAVAMLLSQENAAQFVALTLGNEPTSKDALDEGDVATLTEVAESCLGGGVSNLMDTCGLEPEQLEDVSVSVESAVADELLALLGDGAVMAPFKFSSPPELEGGGVLLFSEEIEAMVPPDVAGPSDADADVDALAANAHLTEAEMSDILSGFSPEAAEEIPMADRPPPPVTPPATVLAGQSNLDMVLDIKLVATARLGRIEMPVGEILALGPGSIIEVGHLVDEPIELLVNEKLIARGDVVVIDEKFGLRITEIISPQERIESLR